MSATGIDERAATDSTGAEPELDAAATACIDGNEAAAKIAYALSEVVAIYPITPASTMGELADAWSTGGDTNLWGAVPEVVELQSEAGAAGTLHGALQTGALGTTFTASQGLLLMLPNMYKIAGELTPAVIHVAARAIATHALSIFGDHSDVMSARSTGFAMLCAGSVQEAHDFAAVSHAATLRARVPFLHFFDGFRTSHEINRIDLLGDDDLRALIHDEDIAAHKLRRLRPTAPVIRGTAQNPDVFFQAREAANRYHDAVPGIVEDVFAELEARTGRRYGLVDYEGAPDAERVIVMMGSGAGAAGETVAKLVAQGEKVGLATIRLFRPFPIEALLDAIPDSVRSIAVLDRCKEPGSAGEPLFQDVVTAIAESDRTGVRTIGGRYGLGSKEFTPAMVKAVFDELTSQTPKRRFTVGIVDDVTGLSLEVDESFAVEQSGRSAVFYALGSDGTVGANKASVKIIGHEPDLFAQGYFVYDSKKSGSMTVSHLRFGPQPIRSTYLVQEADLVACHQFGLLDRFDVLGDIRDGGTFLLNAPYPADELWEHLPTTIQRRIHDRNLRVFTIDATRIARELKMPGRINTIMQPCFFALTDVMDLDRAVAAIKASIDAAYGRRGRLIVERNEAAVDRSLAELAEVTVPSEMPPSVELDETLDILESARGERRDRLRRPGHDDDDRQPGRPASGLGDADRRHVPDGHDAIREAQARHRDPGVGAGPVHRLRQVRRRLPTCDDPDEGLRARRPRRSARRLPHQVVPFPRTRRAPAHDPGGPRRLHGVWHLRRRVPRQGQVPGEAQGDQHATGARTSGGRTRAVGLLHVDPRARPGLVHARLGEELPAAATLVRVLRCLLRLRRDAVPEAAHAAVR